MFAAIGDELGLSFVKGLVAAVNPCAFVLLPTYLMLFLGIGSTSDARVSMRRALTVSVAVSSGFLAVFVVLGVISEFVTGWFLDNSKYATGVIGVVFVVLGAAMLFGHAPKLSAAWTGAASERVDATTRGMFLYGVVYAVASLGCTLPLFMTTVFDGARRDGFGMAMVNVVAYAVAITLVITALTVALSWADTGLARVLRAASRYTAMLGAAFVLLSGLYLLYYFWTYDVNGESTSVIDAVDRLQRWAQRTLVDHTGLTALVLAAVVAAAVGVVWSRRRDVPTSGIGSPGSDV